MKGFDLVNNDTAPAYPGHIIVVAGDSLRISGQLVVKGRPGVACEEPLEAAIHLALLVRQRDALPIGVMDEKGLWPERLGQLVRWTP